MLSLPVDVITMGVLPFLRVPDIQSLDTACTNKVVRPQLRSLWASYRWDCENVSLSMSEVEWLCQNGMNLVGIKLGTSETHDKSRFKDIVSLLSTHAPLLKKFYCRYEYLANDMLTELALGCPQLEIVDLSVVSVSTGMKILAKECNVLHNVTLRGYIFDNVLVYSILC